MGMQRNEVLMVFHGHYILDADQRCFIYFIVVSFVFHVLHFAYFFTPC